MKENNDKNKNNLTLRVAETNPKFVGRGVALVDPNVMEKFDLATGDVIEIRGARKKTFVLLWSSQPSDYGRGLIRIDGYTRNNIGIGIDDRVNIQKVTDVTKAEQVILSPTEELNIVGLEEHLPERTSPKFDRDQCNFGRLVLLEKGSEERSCCVFGELWE